MLINFFKKIFSFSNKSIFMAVRFVFGNFISAFFTGIGTLFIAKFISPQILGDFNKYSILTGYLTLFIYFVDASFQRDFTYHIGKGEMDLALHKASVAKWWFGLVSFIGILIFLTLIIISFISISFCKSK